MFRIIYWLLLWALSPFALLYLFLEQRRRGGGQRFYLQRLGFAYSDLPANALCFHAASVGEVNTIKPLIASIQSSAPEQAIIITTNTPTGADIVASIQGVHHAFLPLDYACAVQRFFKAVQPKQLVIVETELWPNLYRFAHKHGCAPVIINGRLSSKSLDKRWAYPFYRASLQYAYAVYTRGEEDTRAFKTVADECVPIQTIGNLKWAGGLLNPDDFPNLIQRPYVIAASTHHDEEQQLAIEWCRQTRKSVSQKNEESHAQRLFVITPRHAERGMDIAQQLREQSIRVAQRSVGEPIQPDTQIYLADTMGELLALMAHADAVFMGGSLIPHGGQNVIEPIRLGKSVVCGPYMENFLFETQTLIQYKVLIQLQTVDELIKRLLDLSLKEDDTVHSIELVSFLEQQLQVKQRYMDELIC